MQQVAIQQVAILLVFMYIPGVSCLCAGPVPRSPRWRWRRLHDGTQQQHSTWAASATLVRLQLAWFTPRDALHQQLEHLCGCAVAVVLLTTWLVLSSPHNPPGRGGVWCLTVRCLLQAHPGQLQAK